MLIDEAFLRAKLNVRGDSDIQVLECGPGPGGGGDRLPGTGDVGAAPGQGVVSACASGQDARHQMQGHALDARDGGVRGTRSSVPLCW